jgi:hypothetical protein
MMIRLTDIVTHIIPIKEIDIIYLDFIVLSLKSVRHNRLYRYIETMSSMKNATLFLDFSMKGLLVIIIP